MHNNHIVKSEHLLIPFICPFTQALIKFHIVCSKKVTAFRRNWNQQCCCSTSSCILYKLLLYVTLVRTNIAFPKLINHLINSTCFSIRTSRDYVQPDEIALYFSVLREMFYMFYCFTRGLLGLSLLGFREKIVKHNQMLISFWILFRR